MFAIIYRSVPSLRFYSKGTNIAFQDTKEPFNITLKISRNMFFFVGRMFIDLGGGLDLFTAVRAIYNTISTV